MVTQALEMVLGRVEPKLRTQHGIPQSEDMCRRERGARIVSEVLSRYTFQDGIRVSPLGSGWSSDIDVHVRSWPGDTVLLNAGWLPLDRLLTRLGYPGRGRWAVTSGPEILVRVELHAEPAPNSVDSVLSRCHRRREVRLREALELARLREGSHTLDRTDPAVRAAASVESWWGGDALSDVCTARPVPGPVALRSRWTGRLRSLLRRIRTLFSSRMTIAISGVDGAGKTTAGKGLRASLSNLGIPVASIWARPGLRLGVITRISRPIKRMLGQPSGPGVAYAARGDGTRLHSRRGFVGWVWSLIVTVAFLVDVYRQHFSTRGIVLYDRHVIDAIATLNALYAGPNLALQRALIRRLMPRAELTCFLEIDAEVAVQRKPDDMIGRHAVEAQLSSYEAEKSQIPNLIRLDGAGPLDQNVFEVVCAICNSHGTDKDTG